MSEGLSLKNIADVLDVSDDDFGKYLTPANLRALAARIRELDQPIEVGVFVEGGVVQWARASTPCDVFVVDLDVFEGCGGGTAGKCRPSEHQADREEHVDMRTRLERYNALAHGVY